MSKFGIGERIKKLREMNNLTQTDLATKLKITHQSISKWEREESVPDTLMVIELSKVFSVSTDYLLVGKTDCLREENNGNLKVRTIKELSHEELLALYSTVLVKDMEEKDRVMLQNLGFISLGSNPEWTVEGKQLSDKYWYNCSEAILKEIEENTNIVEVYLAVNKKIDISKKLFYRFIDDLVSSGKITQISSLIQKNMGKNGLHDE